MAVVVCLMAVVCLVAAVVVVVVGVVELTRACACVLYVCTSPQIMVFIQQQEKKRLNFADMD